MAEVTTTFAKEVRIHDGERVLHRGRKAVISRVLGLDSVLITYVGDDGVAYDRPERANIAELYPAVEVTPPEKVPDLSDIPRELWEIAKRRYEIINPLVFMPERTRVTVQKRAREFGQHVNTLYEWLAKYEANPQLSSLLPKQRSDAGSEKLGELRETIVRTEIERWLKKEEPVKIGTLTADINGILRKSKLKEVHRNTIKGRVRRLSERKRVMRRRGRKAADKLLPHRGKIRVGWPRAVAQIDHTLLDIIVVDLVYRLAICRPWITVLYDVYSRMVLGFYVSLDPPGNFGTGQCIANAILPKEGWLAKHKLDFQWPCWGKPNTIHADNAQEFKGEMLKDSCDQHRIDLMWRPVLKPHYGGHIERYMGNLAESIHALPGTTAKDPRARGDYDSEGRAQFTIDELEAWLLTEVIRYNSQLHSELGMSPRQRYEDGLLLGTDSHPPTGIPPRITDPEAQMRLRLDFMPFELRTIQQYGVKIDRIRYFEDTLQPWINATDPANPKRKLKFKFRRDPRDISIIWFYDPTLKEYLPIPYRDTSLSPMSIWDLRRARKELKRQGVKGADIDERILSDTHDKHLEQLAQADSKTKAVRRDTERRRQWKEKVTKPGPPKELAPRPEPAKVYVKHRPFTDED